MKIVFWKELTKSQQEQILQRSIALQANIVEETSRIIEEIKLNQDEGLKKLTLSFDKVMLNDLVVSEKEKRLARKQLTIKEKEVLRTAKNRIEAHAVAQFPKIWRYDSQDGIVCERQPRAIESVGLYVPGGTAPLVSTVMMLAIPAKVAGCSERILCTPPNREGEISPYILVAAQDCGIEKIYKVGGAQAIAAMAYGTQSVPKVDKIFGPGNAWVTQAKLLCALKGIVNIDMPAGPSELMMITDESANPKFVAADLLSQAEHDPQAQVFLITTALSLAQHVVQEIDKQKTQLERIDIIQQALKNSKIIVVESLLEAIEISNRYAPEHLSLQLKDAQPWISRIEHAGTVFVGEWAAESLGDYITGANHVLPTQGYTRSWSGLSVMDFIKWVGFQYVEKQGLIKIGQHAAQLAYFEKLHAHEMAVKIRLEEIVHVN